MADSIGTVMTEITESIDPSFGRAIERGIDRGRIEGTVQLKRPTSTADSVTSVGTGDNDQAIFNALYRQYWPSLLRLATVMTGSAQEGQDLAQEAFARWYVHRGNVRNDEAYLRVTLINLVRGRGRGRKRAMRALPMLEHEARQNHDNALASNDLADVLAKLPIRQRAAIVLKYYEGRTEQEIATLLGCRPGTVKSLLSRALQELWRVIEPSE